MISYLPIISGVLGIFAYIPTIFGILKNKSSQNFCTWLLWGILDTIIALSLYVQDGNYFLAFAHGIGCFLVAFFLFRKKELNWSIFETLISLLVGVCIVIWIILGPLFTTIMATVSILVAGLPQIKEVFLTPKKTSPFVWLLLSIANISSILAGKNWSIAQRLFPTASAIYCLLVLLLSLRRYCKPRKF